MRWANGIRGIVLALAVWGQEMAVADTPKKTGLAYADRATWRALLQWPDWCERGFALTGKTEAGLRFYTLQPSTYLVEVSCAPGAYQGSHAYIYWNETKSPPEATLLEFPVYEPDEDHPAKLRKTNLTELWGSPVFSEKTGQLVVLSLSRDLGDCGWMGAYTFPQGKVRLDLFRIKTACDGKLVNQPDRWRRVSVPGG